MTKTVYANVSNIRLGATLDNQGMVHVWEIDGRMLGLFRIDRFEGKRLTSGTLYELFHPKTVVCVGCFNPVPGDHSKGCPTGQNGTPNYN